MEGLKAAAPKEHEERWQVKPAGISKTSEKMLIPNLIKSILQRPVKITDGSSNDRSAGGKVLEDLRSNEQETSQAEFFQQCFSTSNRRQPDGMCSGIPSSSFINSRLWWSGIVTFLFYVWRIQKTYAIETGEKKGVNQKCLLLFHKIRMVSIVW